MEHKNDEEIWDKSEKANAQERIINWTRKGSIRHEVSNNFYSSRVAGFHPLAFNNSRFLILSWWIKKSFSSTNCLFRSISHKPAEIIDRSLEFFSIVSDKLRFIIVWRTIFLIEWEQQELDNNFSKNSIKSKLQPVWRSRSCFQARHVLAVHI